LRRDSWLVSRPSRRPLAPSSSTSSGPRLRPRDAISEFWGHPEKRTFGELLIDLEEEPAAKAVIGGLLREMEPGR
jgi:hypothetical protein